MVEFGCHFYESLLLVKSRGRSLVPKVSFHSAARTNKTIALPKKNANRFLGSQKKFSASELGYEGTDKTAHADRSGTHAGAKRSARTNVRTPIV